MWTHETMQLRTVCDKRLYVPITSGSFEAKISIDIQQTFSFCNNVSVIGDQIFATDFLRFFQSHFKKNVKSHVFWNLKKKRKIRILEHCHKMRWAGICQILCYALTADWHLMFAYQNNDFFLSITEWRRSLLFACSDTFPVRHTVELSISEIAMLSMPTMAIPEVNFEIFGLRTLREAGR